MVDHDDRLAITADHDDADDDDGGDQEAEQYAHGGDVGDGGRKLAYQRIPLLADAVLLRDPKGPYSYERIVPKGRINHAPHQRIARISEFTPRAPVACI